MEIKAEIVDFTKEQKQEFIVEQNHNNGYEIRYTEKEIEETIIDPETGEEIIITKIVPVIQAWGYTEEEKEEQEKARIGNLKCTKRVLVLMLQELQYNWFTTIKPLIESNPQAQLEWELCVELERKNPMLDLIGGQLGIEPEQIDKLFKYANGEITQQEFLNK